MMELEVLNYVYLHSLYTYCWNVQPFTW